MRETIRKLFYNIATDLSIPVSLHMTLHRVINSLYVRRIVWLHHIIREGIATVADKEA